MWGDRHNLRKKSDRITQPSCLWSHRFILRGMPTDFGSNTSFEFDMRVKTISVLISTRTTRTNRYFRVQFYASATIHISSHIYVRTNRFNFHSIEISRWWSAFLQKETNRKSSMKPFCEIYTVKVRNAIDSSRSLIGERPIAFCNPINELTIGAYRSRKWHDINRQKTVF